ncbi:Uncharacterised protein [Burkholderia pseudomallei]|nr:Uncharacterised protein [Burkholderia pseudomallei]
MSRLGIERQHGLIYEGKDGPSHLVVPTPMVSQCALVESTLDPSKLPQGMDSDPFRWVFREDSFDPVSRVRRGRLFQSFGNISWESVTVNAHPFSAADLAAGRSDGRISKEMSVFIHCTQLLSRPRQGEGMQLAIGTVQAHSLWRILQSELTVNQDVVVTLRAESPFAVLPPLETDAIPEGGRKAVTEAYERVMNVAYRDSPTSVVDQCRNLAAVLGGRWLFQNTGNEKKLEDDLGACISAIRDHFGEKNQRLVRAALETINLLHPRGKDNERVRYGLREVSNEDAELALHAAGFVLREIGWGR